MMLNRFSSAPLYDQLKQALLVRIKNGEFTSDTPLPTETELIKQYDVSRITVRRAMRELELEGHIYRIPGKGTFILEPKIKREMSRLTSFTEDMLDRQITDISSRLLDFHQEPASEHVAEKLGISPQTPVWFIRRLRIADDQPIAIGIAYISLPPHIAISAIELEEVGSLFALLESKGVTLIEADRNIEAILANQESAKLLEVQEGAPLLFVEGVVYTQNNAPIEYHQIIGCGERYKYSLFLKR